MNITNMISIALNSALFFVSLFREPVKKLTLVYKINFI